MINFQSPLQALGGKIRLRSTIVEFFFRLTTVDVYSFKALEPKKIQKTWKKELTQTNSLGTMYKCLRERRESDDNSRVPNQENY
ncbi:MAG: hypothetical protein VKN72_24800, partial [Nostocales cyanobacterium 94392]|nr:hypothetical protein [Nostocales cyanobacterium 94392]